MQDLLHETYESAGYPQKLKYVLMKRKTNQGNVFQRLAPSQAENIPTRVATGESSYNRPNNRFNANQPSTSAAATFQDTNRPNNRFTEINTQPSTAAADAFHDKNRNANDAVMERRKLFEFQVEQNELKASLKRLEEKGQKAEAEAEEFKKKAELEAFNSEKKLEELTKKIETTKGKPLETNSWTDSLGLENRQRLFRIKCSRCGFDPKFEMRESNIWPGYFLIKGKGEGMGKDE